MDHSALDLIRRLGAMLDDLPRREQLLVFQALTAIQARISDGVDRLLTPEEAATLTGWRPGTDTGISPRWIYDNWRRLPPGVARKISYRKLRLVGEAWRRWIESGEQLR